MKVLILGHARHGKDTVAQLIFENTGLTFISSSMMAMEHVIWPVIGHEYKSKEECFQDRVNRRALWFKLISDFNKDDPSRLCQLILDKCDIYVGMRSAVELEASLKLFDLILWVDASERLPPESRESCSIVCRDDFVRVPNNKDLTSLQTTVSKLCSTKFNTRGNNSDKTTSGVGDVDRNGDLQKPCDKQCFLCPTCDRALFEHFCVYGSQFEPFMCSCEQGENCMMHTAKKVFCE